MTHPDAFHDDTCPPSEQEPTPKRPARTPLQRHYAEAERPPRRDPGDDAPPRYNDGQ